MRAEILRFVDIIHREKDIDKEAVFLGLEAAIQSAILKKWGETDEAEVAINRESGEVTATVGDVALDQRQLQEQLGRLAAQTGKQVLYQKIREAAREVVYQEFIGRIGTLVTGTVQRYEGPNLIINLQRGEGVLPRSEQVPIERFRIGDRMKVLVRDVVRNGTQVKIILTRSDALFVRSLFELEVPEIKDGTIEIVSIAREPGHRTKIAVTSADVNVDCVGACVGVRGSRVKTIKEELFGEKIEIVRWDQTQEVLIVNALKPAEIVSIDLDYDRRRARVYVTPDQQSLAIGKRGQNVRLASELTDWDIDIVSVSQDDIERLRTEDVEEGGDIGEVVGTARTSVREDGEAGGEEAALLPETAEQAGDEGASAAGAEAAGGPSDAEGAAAPEDAEGAAAPEDAEGAAAPEDAEGAAAPEDAEGAAAPEDADENGGSAEAEPVTTTALGDAAPPPAPPAEIDRERADQPGLDPEREA
jgi:N utilization substance protein A